MRGIERFHEFFRGFENQYVLIGGAACELIFTEQGALFRATKDLDIVLVVESITHEFGVRLWDFIHMGGYEIKCRSNGAPILYRFSKPKNSDFPYMIELFSRGFLDWPTAYNVLPISFDDTISSLSAILLDESYYKLIVNGSQSLHGISLLRPEFILLLKARAFLDYLGRYMEGAYEHESDIRKSMRKHRDDALRLATILVPDLRVDLPSIIKSDLKKFLDITRVSKEDVSPSFQKRVISLDEIIVLLQNIYGIGVESKE